MKKIKWKYMMLTCTICLLPIIFGIILWDKLPQTIAIHFNLYNEPDGFTTKGFAVFGLPVMMAFLQAISCLINDINAFKYGERKKFEHATKWIIPIMCILLQAATLAYALGRAVDIRRVACGIVGVIFLVIGNYLPKLDYVKSYDLDTQKSRKINRFIGYESFVLGLLFILGIFLPPAFNVACLLLLIPYAIVSVVYSVWVIKRG